MTNTDNLISLLALAEEFGCNKSRLAYYVEKGLLKRVATIGRMGVFDKKHSMAVLNKIKNLKEDDLSLDKIAERIKDV